MNKKFTMLFAAALLSGSFIETTFAENVVTAKSISDVANDGKYYALKASHLYSNNDWAQEPGFNYVVTEDGSFVRKSLSASATSEVLKDDVWKVSKSSTAAGTVYTFTNKNNVKFKVSGVEGYTLRETSKNVDDAVVYGLNLDSESATFVAVDGNQVFVSSANGAAGAAFIVEALKNNDVTAKEMNSIQGGDGLVFAYPTERQTAVNGDILTGKQMLAVEVEGTVKDSEGHIIPAGVYFITKADEALKLTKESKLENKADQVAAFLKSEFVAVNPSAYNNTSNWDRANGVGFSLTAINGESFSFETTTKDEEVSINNACFTVAEPDAYTTSDQYTLSVAANLEVKDGENHQSRTVNIAVLTANGSDYMVTSNTASQLFKTQASATSALIDATTLLNSDKTPAIYAIKVLSGEAKDQYLTNGKYSMPNVDVNDPTNQYVITNVTENNVVTFKNRVSNEPASIVVSFYGDNADLTYKVVATGTNAQINYAKSNDDKVAFETANPANLNGETVELIKVTPNSKFDSFVNREETDYSLVSFRVAPNAETDRYLNINVPLNDEGVPTTGNMLYDEDTAAKFMLVNKNYKTDGTYNTVSDFAYLKGEKVETVQHGDTVAYPTYQVKVYEPKNFDQPNTGKFIGGNYALVDGNKTALDFIVKENADGSIYLVTTGGVVATWDGEGTGSKGNEVNGSANQLAYTSNKTTSMTTLVNLPCRIFINDDNASVSLEAKSQHVSMQETVAAGYIMADDNNDAIVKGAEKAAVLWLDTTKTEAAIPTFYISQAGKFLYNAEDSVNTVGGDRYVLEGTSSKVAKLIFKKAELVNSDTLKTTVDAKEVLVAEKANALENTVAGIEKFQYQILRTEEGADEYTIRQGGKYVRMINGQLTLADISDVKPMVVTINTESAPTSNENVVVASEVKVVAQDGAVVVKNAAGKNVVVSTILGQVVANEVLTSDNATINVPAGIVVVAVEGESFKVNVK